MKDDLKIALKAKGIPPHAMEVIQAMIACKPPSQTWDKPLAWGGRLAGSVDLDPADIEGALDFLEDAGWITESNDADPSSDGYLGTITVKEGLIAIFDQYGV